MSMLTWEKRVELAQRYAPRLILFPEQQQLGKPKIEGGAGDYHPRSVELLLDHGRLFPGTRRSLRQRHINWLFNHASRPPATLDNLSDPQHAADQLRLLGGPLPDPQQAWTAYFNILRARDEQGRAGLERYPLTTYAHVITRAEAEQACRADAKLKPEDYRDLMGRPFYQPAACQADDVALQFWFCYYFDDWANIHEGDWESITLFFRRQDSNWQPLGATYSAHENGTRRHWEDVELAEGDHPLVYVASGSHAAYFQHVPEGHSTELAGIFLGRLKFKIGLSASRRDFVPAKHQHAWLTPSVEVLPDPIGLIGNQHPAARHLKWLGFKGSWGARELGKLIAGGPTGPAQKGLKWLNPFAWSEAECWPDYLVY